MMRSSNPTLLGNPFSTLVRGSQSDVMTMSGTIWKSGILLLLTFFSATYVWSLFLQANGHFDAISGYLYGGVFGGMIAALVTTFKKEWAPYTAPAYAVLEGLFLGGISAVFQAAYPGIIFQALTLTFATAWAMLVAYRFGWMEASEPFKRGVIAATGGICLAYLCGMVLSFFGVQLSFLYGNGLFGIFFSIVVVGIAAMNLIIDFDFIERGSRVGAPKYMEWYGAFALMVTLVWLYVEMLRLLSKINSRR